MSKERAAYAYFIGNTKPNCTDILHRECGKMIAEGLGPFTTGKKMKKIQDEHSRVCMVQSLNNQPKQS